MYSWTDHAKPAQFSQGRYLFERGAPEGGLRERSEGGESKRWVRVCVFYQGLDLGHTGDAGNAYAGGVRRLPWQQSHRGSCHLEMKSSLGSEAVNSFCLSVDGSDANNDGSFYILACMYFPNGSSFVHCYRNCKLDIMAHSSVCSFWEADPRDLEFKYSFSDIKRSCLNTWDEGMCPREINSALSLLAAHGKPGFTPLNLGDTNSHPLDIHTVVCSAEGRMQREGGGSQGKRMLPFLLTFLLPMSLYTFNL